MRVMVAMSGGVDSSVAAARCRRDGHEVVGVTLKLWGGPTDRGCCSVADVEDARRVADHLGIDHHVFNYAEEFNDNVVSPYLEAHRRGLTPNPCIECNRHIKFDLLHARAMALGFDAVATGHHAQIAADRAGALRLARGADPSKDQSYVLYMIDDEALATTLFPVGSMTKTAVRSLAQEWGLRTATKPDSQDVCFIAGQPGVGRETFLGDRIALRPARVLDSEGRQLAELRSIEMVTVGQRKGLGLAGGTEARYVTNIDHQAGTVTVGPKADLLTDRVQLQHFAPAGRHLEGPLLAQCSAHGTVSSGRLDGSTLWWDQPHPLVAPGQSVVFYDPADPSLLLGGALAAPGALHR